MIIGVTGTDGSGKDTVARLLWEKLGWPHYSLSDQLRAITRERGLTQSRETWANLGNELRERYGPGYIAELIMRKAGGRDLVVTSVRNPAECEPFRTQGRFILIAVDAPLEIRYARTSGRDRAGEAGWTLDDFRRHEEEIEMEGGEFGQRLRKMLELADVKIVNDGTIEELGRKVDNLITTLCLQSAIQQ